jgi:hypothetical protein
VRVEMASDRLMSKLIDIAYDDGRPAKVQLDAIKDALNRAGVVTPTQIEVGPITPHEEIFADIQTGSRADYRNGVGTQEHSHLDDLYDSGEISYKDYSGPFDPEDTAGQSDSEPFDPPTATPNRRPERERTSRPRDSGPPSARRSDEQRSGHVRRWNVRSRPGPGSLVRGRNRLQPLRTHNECQNTETHCVDHSVGSFADCGNSA